MKKGLLSILAGALLVVGCQNYDDQFDSLEQQINALAAQASAITQVQSDLSALATQVSGLAGQLSAADLASVTSQVDAIKTQIDALSSVGEEVDNLNEEVDDILEALGELLQANAVIEQDLKISNEAELEYVEGLIGTEDDDPTVIIKGNLEVLGANLDSEALAARLNAVTKKIKTVIGTVTITADAAAIDASTIGFINGDASISNDVTITSLATVSGDLDLGHYGDVDLTQLITVTSLDLTNAQSITTLNIGSLSGALNTREFVLATSISLGDIPLTGIVTATAAETFTWGFDAAITESLTLVTSTTTKIFANSVPSITNTVTLNNSAADAEGHFDALVSIATGSGLFLPAPTIDLDSFTTASGTLVINGVASAELPLLTVQGAPISASNATTFSAPGLTDADTITTSPTATIEVASVNDPKNYTASPTALGLTAASQVTSLTLSAFPALTAADITVAGTSTSNIKIEVTAASTALADFTVGGVVNTLDIQGAPLLTSVTTTGNITDFTVANTATITSIDFGHSYISGDTAATVSVVALTGLTTLDMSSLTKVKTVNLQGNTSLASVVAPSSTVLAEPVAAISVTFSGNALTGNYNNATAGSETTEYKQAEINSAEILAFKAFIEAYAAQPDRAAGGVASDSSTFPSITYDMNVDVVTLDGGTTTNTLAAALAADAAANNGLDGQTGTAATSADDATDGAGGVNTKNELDLVKAASE